MTIDPFWVQVNEPTLRQGDYLPGCLVPVPLFDPTTFGKKDNETQEVEVEVNELDLIVLTQSCDLDIEEGRRQKAEGRRFFSEGDSNPS